MPESVTWGHRRGREKGRPMMGSLEGTALERQAIPSQEQRKSHEDPWQKRSWRQHHGATGKRVALGGRLPTEKITRKALTCRGDGPGTGNYTEQRMPVLRTLWEKKSEGFSLSWAQSKPTVSKTN